MSKQLELAKDSLRANESLIMKEMIRRADMFVGGDLDSEEAYNMLFGDGAFEPFFAVRGAGSEYNDYVAEHGNEEDEITWITCIWISTLVMTDYDKYIDIIIKFIEIEAGGA